MPRVFAAASAKKEIFTIREKPTRRRHYSLHGRDRGEINGRWKTQIIVAILPEQLAICIDKWAGPLRAWLRRRCPNPDDIVQEAFCKLAQQSRTPERIAPWLFLVATNLVREESRRTKRRQQRESVVAKTENHISSASQSLEDAELRNAVETLPEELREIVIARVWGELTLAEISKITGHSIATTHRRYEQALNQLRSQLSEKPPQQGVHNGRPK